MKTFKLLHILKNVIKYYFSMQRILFVILAICMYYVVSAKNSVKPDMDALIEQSYVAN